MALDYFYDQQFRRYWLQFVRIFEGIQYRTGRGANGQTILRTVPAKWAGKDRVVGHILRNNSENTLMTTPQITCSMLALSRAPERIQNPNHISSVNIVERAIDPLTNKYTDQPGRSYTVERYMSVPYNMTLSVDIWTSNEDQKAQIMEQLLILFNPSIDLQTGTNPIDWTSLGIVELEDISWSSRSMPMGTEDDIEISTLTFNAPVWLSPPAKLKKQNIIQQIVTNISVTETLDENNPDIHWSESDMRSRTIVTPGNHKISVEYVGSRNLEVTLLGEDESDKDKDGNPYDWVSLLRLYGKIRPGVSQIRLKTGDDIEDHNSDIVGTFDIDPVDVNIMHITLDPETIAPSTLSPLTGIIDPTRSHPLSSLDTPVNGMRYMIIGDIAADSPAWNGFTAKDQDIIEYVNNQWVVVFEAATTVARHHVVNSVDNKQYLWTGSGWRSSLEGIYNPGYWRVFL